jgi:hypothetical protein
VDLFDRIVLEMEGAGPQLASEVEGSSFFDRRLKEAADGEVEWQGRLRPFLSQMHANFDRSYQYFVIAPVLALFSRPRDRDSLELK